ncbi:MAG: hypothetical protein U9Q63_01490, partial [Patescibacteria group bacterium]|nr:hypothetical protein [Patescibacteria group bacterium]
KWKACPGCSVSYKPYYETQGNSEEQSCVMAGVVYLPGDEVKTALGTFKCVSGKMEEIDEEKISELTEAFLACKSDLDSQNCIDRVLNEIDGFSIEIQEAQELANQEYESKQRMISALDTYQKYSACVATVTNASDCNILLDNYKNQFGILNESERITVNNEIENQQIIGEISDLYINCKNGNEKACGKYDSKYALQEENLQNRITESIDYIDEQMAEAERMLAEQIAEAERLLAEQMADNSQSIYLFGSDYQVRSECYKLGGGDNCINPNRSRSYIYSQLDSDRQASADYKEDLIDEARKLVVTVVDSTVDNIIDSKISRLAEIDKELEITQFREQASTLREQASTLKNWNTVLLDIEKASQSEVQSLCAKHLSNDECLHFLTSSVNFTDSVIQAIVNKHYPKMYGNQGKQAVVDQMIYEVMKIDLLSFSDLSEKEQEVWNEIAPTLSKLGQEEKYRAMWETGQMTIGEIEDELDEAIRPSGYQTEEHYQEEDYVDPADSWLNKLFLTWKTKFSGEYNQNQAEGLQTSIQLTNPQMYEEYRNQYADSQTYIDCVNSLGTLTPDECIRKEFEAFFKTEKDFTDIGVIEDRQAYIYSILRGEISAIGGNEATSWSQIKLAKASDAIRGAFRAVFKPDKQLIIKESLESQRYNWQAVITINQNNYEISGGDPDKLDEINEQRAKNSDLYQEWHDKPQNYRKTFEDFQLEQLVEAKKFKEQANSGDIVNEQISSAIADLGSSWLENAALSGNLHISDFIGGLESLRGQYIEIDNSDPDYEREIFDEDGFNEEASKLITQTFVNNLSEDQKSYLIDETKNSQVYKNYDGEIEDFWADQFNSRMYAEDKGLDLMLSALAGAGRIDKGTADSMIFGGMSVLTGEIDYIAIGNRLRNANGLEKVALWLNKHTTGAFGRGTLVKEEAHEIMRNSENIKEWTIGFGQWARGEVMAGGQIYGEILVVAMPGLRIFQAGKIAGSAITLQTAFQIGGEALGMKMTGSSMAQTAEVCGTGDTAGCISSAGMTLFSALSTGMASVNLNKSLGSLAKVAKIAQRGALEAGADVAANKVAVNQAVLECEKAMGNMVQSQGMKILDKTVNALGTSVFGYQAYQACSQQGMSSDCLVNGAMALLSFARLSMPMKEVNF